MNLGDYTISNKRIGKGGFSVVYLGEQKYTKQQVAVKKIDVENIYKLNKNIKREIELHKKIKHRNIISLYDIIYDDKNHYIYLILEYCEKGDFAKFQNKQPLKEIYIQKYIKDLSEGLKYLSQYNIIHRDLKPQNLLISNCGDIKISDFGFAKEHNNIDNLKQTYCGSPLYMAPEILHYQKYNSKSDLWSVGIIIYEMITGKPPYHVKNFYQLMKLIDKENIVLPYKYKLYISKELQNLLLRLLVKEPERRIGWSEFFNVKWLKDTILERENNLLNINFNNLDKTNNGMNSSLLNKEDIKIPTNKFTTEKITTNLYSLDNIENFNNNINFDLVFNNSEELEKSTDTFYSAEDLASDDDDELAEELTEKQIKLQELKDALNETDLPKPINVIKQPLKTSIEIIEDEYDLVNKNDLSNPLEKISLNLNSINKLDANIKHITLQTNYPFKKLFNSSYSILKESFDYLSSHNKSI